MSGKAWPPDWPRVRFGDVVRNVNDNVRNPLDSGLERFVGLEHIDPESLHIKRWGLLEEGTTFTRKFVKGQVLFGKRRAYQRKVAIAEFEGICSGDILVFEPANDDLLPELLPFIVQSDGFFEHALGTSAGSLSPRTKWKDLARYEFALPPKDEQRRIAEILWAADEAIRAEEMLEDQLNYSRSLFFEDLIGAKESVDEDSLDAFAIFITDGDHNPPRRVAKGIPHVVVQNIVDGRFDLSECTFISVEDFERVKRRYNSEANDIVITCVGTIGRAALVPEGFLFSADRSLAIIRFDIDRVLPHYGLELIRSRSVQTQMLRRSIGTAQQHLYLKDIRSLRVRVPNINVQCKIVNAMQQFGSATNALKNELDSLKRLKLDLLRKLLGGKALTIRNM